MQIPYNPGAATAHSWLEPGAYQPSPMYIPGVPYPWMPMPWTQEPEYVCLGSECWATQYLTSLDADRMHQVLLSQSWPLNDVRLALVVLYRRGYRAQVQAVLDVYGGEPGVEDFQRQIDATYGRKSRWVNGAPFSGAPHWANPPSGLG